MMNFINTNTGTVISKKSIELGIDMEEVLNKYKYLSVENAGGIELDDMHGMFGNDNGLPLFILRNGSETTTGIILQNEKDRNILLEKARINDYKEEIVGIYEEAPLNSVIFASDSKNPVDVISNVILFLQALSEREDNYLN